MEIDVLKNTIKKEKQILKEMAVLLEQRERDRKEGKERDKMLHERTILSLIHQLGVLNDSIPELLGKKKEAKMLLPPVPYSRIATTEGKVYVPKAEKEQFLEDLKIEKELLNKIKGKIKKQGRESEKKEVGISQLERTTGIVAISNSLFGSLSSDISKKYFKGLNYSLRKANMPFLLSAYISLTLFSTFVVFILGMIGAFIISIASHADVIVFVRNIAISLILPMITFILFYYYPQSKISGAKQDIETELPFSTVHMSAIASSGVEPSKVFEILSASQEYKNVARECRKIVNQMNIYGYDLTTSLRNVASMASNKKFAELLNGISATITGGGSLSTYLNEKAKDMLRDYRLSREKYSTTLGMYADIYTALLIAAPLIFMLILVIIGSLGTNILGFDAITMSTIGIIILGFLNILFIVFLSITQPKT